MIIYPNIDSHSNNDEKLEALDPRTDFYLSNTEALQMQGLMPYEQPSVYQGGFVDVSHMSDEEIRRMGHE